MRMEWNRHFQPLIVYLVVILIIGPLIPSMLDVGHQYGLDAFTVNILTIILALIMFVFAIMIVAGINTWISAIAGPSKETFVALGKRAVAMGFELERSRGKRFVFRQGTSFRSPVLVAYKDKNRADGTTLVLLKNVKRDKVKDYDPLLEEIEKKD